MFKPDFWRKLKRGPQVILPKDAAAIIAFSGLQQGDSVLEVGAGSGFLTIALANAVGEKGRVVSYERREEFAKLAEKNLERAGLIAEIVVADALDGVKGEYDLIVLGCGEAVPVFNAVKQNLKTGGVLVAYLTQATQVKEFQEHCDLGHERTIEVIVREWKLDNKACRPQNTGLVHTAFLSFYRKN